MQNDGDFMAKSSTPKTKTAAKASPRTGATQSKPVKAVRKVATKASKAVANNPVVAEVVAATLVAAAAALKNPAKARALAESVADELQEASKAAAAKSGAFWQLAMDIARRSVEALGMEKKAKKAAKPKKKADKAKNSPTGGKSDKAKKAKKAEA